MEQIKGAESAIIRIGVLTISDRAARSEMADKSGPAIADALREAAAGEGGTAFIIALTACIHDDAKLITRTLKRWSDEQLCDCILTTGGTGLAERDVTPEATEKALDQSLPHLAAHLALEGVKTVPTAILSRGVAGARSRTLIVNLPGSPNGAAAGARLLAPIIPHAVALLQGRGQADHAAQAGSDDAAIMNLTASANSIVVL